MSSGPSADAVKETKLVMDRSRQHSELGQTFESIMMQKKAYLTVLEYIKNMGPADIYTAKRMAKTALDHKYYPPHEEK